MNEEKVKLKMLKKIMKNLNKKDTILMFEIYEEGERLNDKKRG